MNVKNIIQKNKVRKKAQLGVFPIVAGAIDSLRATGLLRAIGVFESIAFLAILIAVQVYLITARVWFDFVGRS